MAIDHSKIKKILVISLTNIGDIILTFPVIDILREAFPASELSVVVGPKGESLLRGNPHIKNVYLFDKRQSVQHVIRWIQELRKQTFDLIVDLRNSAIPFFLNSRYKTSPFLRRGTRHMRWQHLQRLKSIYPYVAEAKDRYALYVSPPDRQYVEEILKKEMGDRQKFVVIGPGAADQKKRWTEEGFAAVSDWIIQKHRLPVVFVGDEADKKVTQNVIRKMTQPAIDLAGKITLAQLACLLQRCVFAIVNDSAPLHMASYWNVPVLALFGPTNPNRYGPWSLHNCVIRRQENCSACTVGDERSAHTCMQAIAAKDILDAFEIKSDGVAFQREFHFEDMG